MRWLGGTDAGVHNFIGRGYGDGLCRQSGGMASTDGRTTLEEMENSPLHGAKPDRHMQQSGARCKLPWAALRGQLGASDFDWLALLQRDVSHVLDLPLRIISRVAMDCLGTLRSRHVLGLQVYTDGTGGHKSSERSDGDEEADNSFDAAWAVLLVAVMADGSRAMIGAAAGKLDSVQQWFTGMGLPSCGATSHAAELFAATWGMFLASRLEAAGSLGRGLNVDLVSDSEAACKAATGEICPTVETPMCGALRAIFRWLQRLGRDGPRIRAIHVPGHAGHPFNELVDVLAAEAGADRWKEAEVGIPGLDHMMKGDA